MDSELLKGILRACASVALTVLLAHVGMEFGTRGGTSAIILLFILPCWFLIGGGGVLYGLWHMFRPKAAGRLLATIEIAVYGGLLVALFILLRQGSFEAH